MTTKNNTRKIASAKWRAKNKNYHKEWYLKNKERRYFLTKKAILKLDISFDEYKNLIKNQNGLCLICNKIDNNRALSIDHCHKTGKIRGLLCKKCNSGIGFFEDNRELLNKAINYLEKYL